MIGCDIQGMAEAARAAARALASASGEHKNRALLAMAAGLVESRGRLLRDNTEDVAAARAAGQTPAFVDRLTLTESRIDGMARGVRQVAELPDPVTRVASGILTIGFHGYRIVQPAGAGPY